MPYPTTAARVPRWLAVALLALSVTVACGDSAGPDKNATAQDVTENENIFHDEEYIGQQVTVTATVTDVIGPNSFAIGGQEYGEDSLLVLTEQGTVDVHKGEVAHVTGTVERFTFADYADLYGLDDERAYEAYHDKQILIAEDIHLSTPDVP
ncbi:hypothetical protein SAMN05216266_101190 [Amycolatopsis marina]|uniref:DUF5666 domain-containing protein n=1 Tax=Amycolatopsis marina TaxID=490629 RepID=A0A1I0VF12_9PSEU|nr:hypothetical protein [Amycolatopsis marina]SFA74613.1 hypothetical protein SAMN05216266_101190 [Amycolatopsis marina]